MGEKYNFKCSSCGFTATCSNGRDRGFRLVIEPLFCSTCKSLSNIPVGEYKDNLLLPIKTVCWTCKSSETLSKWNGTTCPICNKASMQYSGFPICFD